MSTATLSSLLEYLYGTLTPDNMRWVGEHLIEHANKGDDDFPLKRYTKEEINAMLDEAEAEIAAGIGTPDEEVWRELEEEFAREDTEEDARYASSYSESMLEAV